MRNSSNIAVLITCHNRRDKTIQCLSVLYHCTLPEGFSFEVFLVDDGSTDGTAEIISIKFPEVKIIQGDGNLFWNRGMHLAWQTAKAKNDFDYYLWLNDDTFLYVDALSVLLLQSFKNSIICGTTQSADDQKATYGGYVKNPNRLLIPNDEFQECDYFNGNCVLISKEAFQRIGNLDPIFHHAVGDFDYSLRGKKLGIGLYVAPAFIGTCESHTELPKWRSPKVSVANRLKSLYSASSGCYPPQFFIFDRRHNGILVASFHFFTIHLRAIMPTLWNYRLK